LHVGRPQWRWPSKSHLRALDFALAAHRTTQVSRPDVQRLRHPAAALIARDTSHAVRLRTASGLHRRSQAIRENETHTAVFRGGVGLGVPTRSGDDGAAKVCVSGWAPEVAPLAVLNLTAVDSVATIDQSAIGEQVVRNIARPAGTLTRFGHSSTTLLSADVLAVDGAPCPGAGSKRSSARERGPARS
jgi:hypothetical protein